MGDSIHKAMAQELYELSKISMPLVQEYNELNIQANKLITKLSNGGNKKKYEARLTKTLEKIKSIAPKVKEVKKRRDQLYDKYGYYK